MYEYAMSINKKKTRYVYTYVRYSHPYNTQDSRPRTVFQAGFLDRGILRLCSLLEENISKATIFVMCALLKTSLRGNRVCDSSRGVRYPDYSTWHCTGQYRQRGYYFYSSDGCRTSSISTKNKKLKSIKKKGGVLCLRELDTKIKTTDE